MVENLKIVHYIEQLEKFGHDKLVLSTAPKKELKRLLTIERMREINYDSPENVWFT